MSKRLQAKDQRAQTMLEKLANAFTRGDGNGVAAQYNAKGEEVPGSERSTYILRLNDAGELKICVSVTMGAHER